MGLVSGIFKAATSSIDGSASSWLINSFSPRTKSGVEVSPEGSLSLSSYYSALRNKSEDLAKLPFKVFRRDSNDTKSLILDHPVSFLMNQKSNPETNAMNFRTTQEQFVSGWGNCYAEIERDTSGNATALWIIHPGRVIVRRIKGRIWYEVRVNNSGDKNINAFTFNSQPSDKKVFIAQDNMFHVHGMGTNGLVGYSVLELAAESIGLSLAAETSGSTFFGNGMNLSSVLTHPEQLSDEAHDKLRESWRKTFGDPNNANKMAILEEGLDYKTIGVPPEQAQFLETRRFQVEEIARWFRMPPHKIQHMVKATFNNIEQQNTDYVIDGLMPDSIRWDQEIKTKLIAEEDVFGEHNFTSLLRGDQESRAKFYNTLFSIGSLSPNDIRKRENESPIKNGDQYFVPMNFRPLDSEFEEPNDKSKKTNEDDKVKENDSVKNGSDDSDVDPGSAFRLYEASLDKAMNASDTLMSELAGRIDSKEVKGLDRASKKYSDNHAHFDKWADKFYQELGEQFRDGALIVANSTSQFVGRDSVDWISLSNTIKSGCKEVCLERKNSMRDSGYGGLVQSAFASNMVIKIKSRIFDGLSVKSVEKMNA